MVISLRKRISKSVMDLFLWKAFMFVLSGTIHHTATSSWVGLSVVCLFLYSYHMIILWRKRRKKKGCWDKKEDSCDVKCKIYFFSSMLKCSVLVPCAVFNTHLHNTMKEIIWKPDMTYTSFIRLNCLRVLS